MKKTSSATYFYVGAVVIIVALIGFAAKQEAAPSPYNEFAQCLTDNDAKMYGAWWCPHCEDQKEEFGNAFSKVDYTECSSPGSRTMLQVCKNAGIEGYPTWEFADGSRRSGAQSFETLAQITGCELPTI